ncbi:hypothetical protein P43SY_008246 [Pythium insidiosum]|uniref:Phospholipase/carboxylesterase/thioesterase domain-containing protein n=1 Tax=Pythium insidiosum TaxID=114742 RepID=A0AAD5Q7L4_PYTIN|nr:hypothetical protein P43SY_008246 [Pythium insidiosum]
MPSAAHDEGADVVRVHDAAGVALLRRRADGSTAWVPWPPASATATDSAAPADDVVIDLEERDRAADAPERLLSFHASALGTVFEVVPSADAAVVDAQNLVVLLHGRGDSCRPFAQLARSMALPQTACVALQAPEQLPFGLGPTWYHDLDDDCNVLSASTPHERRSRSLSATAGGFLARVLAALRDEYRWPLDRVFLMGFAQGACVAWHAALTLRQRLGGVVLVGGGAVRGPHEAELPAVVPETPALQLCVDTPEYPRAMGAYTEQQLLSRRPRGAAPLFTRAALSDPRAARLSSAQDTRRVMAFFAAHLFLRDVALEQRSDVIELSTQPPQPRRRRRASREGDDTTTHGGR